jgi:phosphomannomutase/phosphoglucomutase
MMSNNFIKVEDITLNRSIFRSYDIRGVADVDPLNPEDYREVDLTSRQAWLIGKAYGTWVQNYSGPNIVVGRDNRRTSIDIASGFIVGALSSGCNVMDIGLSTTPLLYFSVNELECDGGLMVTGSHNPMWSNGLKLCKKGFQTLVEHEIQELYSIIERNDFLEGEGLYKRSSTIKPYFREIKKRVKPAERKVKVVVDPGNATGGIYGPELLRELGYEVITINDELIYPFPKGSPDPEQPDKVIELGEKVLEVGADIGIAYDGDSDRVGVISNQGEKLESDLLVLFLARSIVQENPGATIIFDVKCSDLLISDIKSFGGNPIMWKTGHSNIKAKMAEENLAGNKALLGGELSGHIFFKDRFFGFDDAIYASCRVLEILSESSSSITEMLSDLPDLETTRELALPCPDEKKALVIEDLQRIFRELGYDILDIDGVRIQFGTNCWALVRASNTQPKLTARFQAPTISELEESVKLVIHKLEDYEFVDISDLYAGLEEVQNE